MSAEANPEVLDNPVHAGKPHARISPLEWWKTPQGENVRKLLRTWGMVVAGRIATGDPAYVPRGTWGTPETARGSRSDAPDAMLAFVDVERVLKTLRNPEARLLHFIYVEGHEWAETQRYHFADGTSSDWMTKAQAPPAAYAWVEDKAELRPVYDLRQFPDPGLPHPDWGDSAEEWLEARHRRAARRIARILGL